MPLLLSRNLGCSFKLQGSYAIFHFVVFKISLQSPVMASFSHCWTLKRSLLYAFYLYCLYSLNFSAWSFVFRISWDRRLCKEPYSIHSILSEYQKGSQRSSSKWGSCLSLLTLWGGTGFGQTVTGLGWELSKACLDLVNVFPSLFLGAGICDVGGVF